MQRIPATTPSEISELARCRAVFTPGDPARTGTVAFRRTDGAAPPSIATGSVETLAVALPDGDGVDLVEVPGVVVPVREALPALTRARADAHTHPAVAFWGAAAVLALQFVARGLLPPGLSPSDHGAWRVGPLFTEDVDRVRRLAAAMPPEAHAVPVDAGFRCGCPSPSGCCAVSPTRWPPHSPTATLVTGVPAYATRPPLTLPEQRAWTTEVAAGHDAGVRLSLRIEVTGLEDTAPDDTPPTFRAVLQVRSVADPTLTRDAAGVRSGDHGEGFGAGARMDVLLALRRAALAWPALGPTPVRRGACRRSPASARGGPSGRRRATAKWGVDGRSGRGAAGCRGRGRGRAGAARRRGRAE
ncbi:hypothetical protein [Streptomyces griseoviridis]|uniref:hypothetical protein n=1 Tax=Streptomyces griseoviridis TaxID=45398 RepID=UPI003F55EAF4